MRFRLLAAVFAVCMPAFCQSLTVRQLVSFLENNQQMVKQGKSSDREVAGFLAHVRLTEKLDDRTIEDLQGQIGLGPKTVEALHRLASESKDLAAAKVVAPAAKPRPIPPPSSEEQAAIVDEVREYALNYSKTLPDFICTQVVRRYAAPHPGTRGGGPPGGDPIWYLQDTLTNKLSYFDQKEDYKLILINNNVTTQDYKTLGGATTTGDFGSMMKEIFEPSTEARFEWDHWATLRGRLTLVFAYHVEQSRSQWHIVWDRKLDIMPAYHGLVYVDKDTHMVTRVTLDASDIPADFPIRSASTILDYDFQDISGHTFLLPLKASTIMSSSEYLTKNDEEFRVYRKYSAESEINFDTPAPLPDDKTKESAPPTQ